MVILRSQNKITDFFMILAWASPFNSLCTYLNQAFKRRKQSRPTAMNDNITLTIVFIVELIVFCIVLYGTTSYQIICIRIGKYSILWSVSALLKIRVIHITLL